VLYSSKAWGTAVFGRKPSSPSPDPEKVVIKPPHTLKNDEKEKNSI